MYNSIIKDKYGVCIDCNDGISKPLIANRCKAFHYPKHLKLKSYKKAQDKQNNNTHPSKYAQSFIDRREKETLEKWFDMVAEQIAKQPYCMECGAFIPEKYYRAASAHILKKSIFISVATNPNNFLILGAGCGCHHAFDNGFMTEMKVFDEAIKRYNIFKDEVKEKHKILELFKINDQLLK